MAQAAEQLQVCEATLYAWLRGGKIPGRKIGKTWRISEEAVLEFLRGDFFVGPLDFIDATKGTVTTTPVERGVGLGEGG